MTKGNNVYEFANHKRDTNMHREGGAETSDNSKPAGKAMSLPQHLRTTIDDGLRQQMREQMRNKHGL
ncbi:hypothetical protein ACVFI8_05855 [Agarivorans sp. MS3-6]|uniref:hypothetical protein n=1 Tax=Agarivorans sp. TSD2052 TaxID=2937286 RepID=UPI00200F19ED|nr:hypothetical protein [Agarivorans sp. TSD2052]UPW19485.1 hypothetical protein M0C34_04180 [Agarivorans sp. TSD2052]